MLIETLRLIKGGISGRMELANKLNIHESALGDILSLLTRKGYLTSIEPSECPPPTCATCSVRKACSSKTFLGKMYLVTEKGRKLLETGYIGS